MLPDPIFLNVHMYGVMMAVGILAAFTVLSLYAKRMGLDEKYTDFVFFTGIGAIAVGLGSAALFQAFYEFLENPEAGFHLSGNITFLGGLIGGAAFFLIVYFILRRRLTARLSETLSIFPCMITVGHAFGRVGCFFAGCCYGKPTDSIFGVQFPHLHQPVHPTQLYEAVFLFLLFALLSVLLLKWNFKHNMSVYLVAYGIFRFVNEIFRGDSRGKLVAGISPSQFWAICMVVLGVALYFALEWLFRRSRARADAAEQIPAEKTE